MRFLKKRRTPIVIFQYILVLMVSFGYSQSAKTINSNPYEVIYNHLYYLQEDSYDPSKAVRSLPNTVNNKETVAIQLKQYLDGKGIFVDINRLPKQTNYTDTIHNTHIYYLDRHEPLIYVERTNNQWHYSRTTVDNIGQLHKKLFPFGNQLLSYFDAPFWKTNLLGLALWKWIGVLSTILIAAVIGFLFYRVINFFLTRFLKSRIIITEAIKTALLKISKLIAFVIAIHLILYLLPMFQIPARINSFLIKLFSVLNIFFVVMILKNVITIVFVYLDKLTLKTENTLDEQLLPVLKKLVYIALWTFAAIYILDDLDVNITALLAGISIGGLALALAAQDTVKNLFGSIMIFLDRPFQIGDWIHFDDVDGVVEEVGVRSTRIRTFANSITYIPNGKLADSVVDNMGLRIYRRFKTEIGITYDTPPEVIEVFVEGIREIIKLHPDTRKDYFEVHLNSFGASSVNILLYMFFKAPTWTDELKGKHEILLAIMKLASKLGVRFAFPTQTLHVEELAAMNDTRTPVSQSEIESKENLNEALDDIKNYFDKDPRRTHNKIKPIGGA